DGDVDLLLSGEDADTGLLTTQLLRNPLVGGGSGFERLSIALPGLKRAVASWGDVDLDGDLDLAVSGVQGSAERPYLQIFRNTTSQRLSDPGEGEPPFAGILNRRPDRPEALGVVWNGAQNAVQLGWSFSHLINDDAPYTYNLGLGRAPRSGPDRVAPGQGLVFDQIAPLADPLSGERRLAAHGNQGFHNQGLFSAGLPGETYHWSVQAIDKGLRGSLWVDGDDFTIQPLQPRFQSTTTVLAGSSLPSGAVALASLGGGGTADLPASAELAIDLDSDGLRDRIRYDAASRRLLVRQGAGADGGALRPFLGPTGALIPTEPTFLANLPVGASQVSLRAVDRSFLADSAEGRWTFSVDLDGADGPAAAAERARVRSGDPLGASLALAGSLLTRQRYRLLDVPSQVRLFLAGDDVREPLRNSDGTPLLQAGAPQFANLSFSLEEARSGALRFLFSQPDGATPGDITLRLAPAVGSGPATYSLRLQDLGDGRPDLLVGWADSGSPGSPQAFALVPNLAVRGNQDPTAPQLHALELAGTTTAPSLRVRWTPGGDLESPASQLRHQWRVTATGALEPGAWQEISGAAAGGSFELSQAELNAAGLLDALQPGSSLGLDLRVVDAGDREARSGVASLRLPALPSPETRPGLIGLEGVRLLEGDNLQHRGSDLIPLQLRQRLLAVEPGAAGALAASQIRLVLPEGFSAAGSFLLRQSDGTTTAAPAATPVSGSPGLLAMALLPAQLEQLVFQPSREATGRLPLSLQWQQPFVTAGVPALTLSQPLELRFRDGGDRIPATASLSESSNPADLWTLSLPAAAVLVDGIGGRPLDFSAISADLSPVNLPGWSERLGVAPAPGDLRLAASLAGSTRRLSVSGSRARALLDGLQILNAEAISGDLRLSHTPVQADAILRHGLPAQAGQPEVLEQRRLTPLLAASKTYRLMVSTTITTTITNTTTALPLSSSSGGTSQVLEVNADADPSAAELRQSLSLAGDYGALPFTISVDPLDGSRLILDWKSGQPQPEATSVNLNLDGTTTTTPRTTSVTLAVLDRSLSPLVPLGIQQLSQPLQLDTNLAGDGRDLLSLRSDLIASGGSIDRVALLPLQVRSDRDLRIPFSKASGLGDVSLSRVDGGGDAAALSLSGGELRLDLPSLPGAPLPRSLSVAAIQERNAGAGPFSLIPAQAWAFGVNPEGGDPVIAVQTSGLLINGAAAPAQLWLRWQSFDDGASRSSGFVAYASAADAAADVGRLALLSAAAGATLVHTPPKGTYQAYRLDF
ncbi:MAG: hypothetical protein ACK46L_14935, partial [Synechococcaceae cyanobacterium]